MAAGAQGHKDCHELTNLCFGVFGGGFHCWVAG